MEPKKTKLMEDLKTKMVYAHKKWQRLFVSKCDDTQVCDGNVVSRYQIYLKISLSWYLCCDWFLFVNLFLLMFSFLFLSFPIDNPRLPRRLCYTHARVCLLQTAVLDAIAAECWHLLSIDISCPRGAQQQTCCCRRLIGQTDGRTDVSLTIS